MIGPLSYVLRDPDAEGSESGNSVTDGCSVVGLNFCFSKTDH